MTISTSAKATVKPVHDAKSGKSDKEPKKVVIPKSVAFAAEKTKSRIVFAVPGRYLLRNRRATFAIVRIADEVKVSPAITAKVFKATASDQDLTHDEMMDLDLEALAESNTPGPKNSSAGNLMGKKVRAANVLARGWWVFRKDAKDQKVAKAYVGPRLSGRRLHHLLDPSAAPKTDVKIQDEAKQNRFSPNDLSPKMKARYVELKGKVKEIDAEIAKGVEKQNSLKTAAAKAKVKVIMDQLQESRKTLVAEINKIRGVKPKPSDKKPADKKPTDAKPADKKPTGKAPKFDISSLTKRQQTAYATLKENGQNLVKAIKELEAKKEAYKTPKAKAQAQAMIDEHKANKNKIAKALADFHEKIRAKQSGAEVQAKPTGPKPEAAKVAEEKVEAVKQVDQQIKKDVSLIDRLKGATKRLFGSQSSDVQAQIARVEKRIAQNKALRKQLTSVSGDAIFFESFDASMQAAFNKAANLGYKYDPKDLPEFSAPLPQRTFRTIIPLKTGDKYAQKGLTVAIHNSGNAALPFELTASID